MLRVKSRWTHWPLNDNRSCNTHACMQAHTRKNVHTYTKMYSIYNSPFWMSQLTFDFGGTGDCVSHFSVNLRREAKLNSDDEITKSL